MQEQKVLWTSKGSWMDETQIANLDEKISEQKSGIVLVFSRYASSQAQNYGWSHYFIPKKAVELHSGGGTNVPIVEGNVAISKYLYIKDDKITGAKGNNEEPSNRFVMREIIGV